MLAKVYSCAVVGLDGEIVEVEVDIGPGLPNFLIVGLPDASVQEAKERVRTAIRNSGCYFPLKRITVNLAPADVKKEGPSYDLPIAVGIIMASQQVQAEDERCLFLGELSLDGALRHTAGILPMVAVAAERGLRTVYVPAADAREASLIEDVRVVPVASLAELVEHLRGDRLIPFHMPDAWVDSLDAPVYDGDMAYVKGQQLERLPLFYPPWQEHLRPRFL